MDREPPRHGFQTPVSRRRFLGQLGAAGTAAIAGCGQDQDTDTPSTNTTSTTTTTAPEPTTRTDTAERTSSPTDTITFDGGGTDVFRGALQTLADNPGYTLEIAPGTYRFEDPGGGPHDPFFHVQNLQGATIAGNGATFVFDGPTHGGLALLGGHDVTIRDLTIDWNPPPFTQGTITDLSDDGHRLVLTVDEGYPPPTHEMFTVAHHAAAHIHQPDGSFITGSKLRGDPAKRFTEVTSLGGRRYEMLVGGRPAQNTRGLKVGRRLAYGARSAKGLKSMNVDDLTLDNITVHTAPGMAVSGEFCSNATVQNVTIAPPSDSDRIAGPIADGINFSNGNQGPRIEDCRLEQLRDDAIVVDTIIHPVTSVIDDHTIAIDPEGRPYVETGDVLEAVTPAGVRTEALPPVASITYRQDFPNSWVPDIPERVTFEEPIRDLVSADDSLANRSQANRDFVVRNNTVRNTAANALRLGSGPGLVEGNTFTGAGRHTIVAASDTGDRTKHKRWTNDVVIRDNQLLRSGLTYFAAENTAAILAHHTTAEGTSVEGHPHRNITVERNRIDRSAHLGIDIKHGEGVDIHENEMRDLNRLVYRNGGGFGIGLTEVVDASVTGNHVAGQSDILYQFGWARHTRGLTASGNTLTIDGGPVTAELVRWTPIHLSFDHTLHPDGGHRHIAFQCNELALLDADGERIIAVDIGGREIPVEFGDGVYFIDQEDGDRWRWFGGRNQQAAILVPRTALEQANRLHLRGRPVDDEMTAEVIVDGDATDSIAFGPGVQEYEAVLD